LRCDRYVLACLLLGWSGGHLAAAWLRAAGLDHLDEAREGIGCARCSVQGGKGLLDSRNNILKMFAQWPATAHQLFVFGEELSDHRRKNIACRPYGADIGEATWTRKLLLVAAIGHVYSFRREPYAASLN
jgi:hypothetical protein